MYKLGAQRHAWHRVGAQELSSSFPQSGMSLNLHYAPHMLSLGPSYLWLGSNCACYAPTTRLWDSLRAGTWPDTSICLLDSWTLCRLSSEQKSITALKWINVEALSTAATSWIFTSVVSNGSTHLTDFYQVMGWLSLKPHQQTGIAWVVLLGSQDVWK